MFPPFQHSKKVDFSANHFYEPTFEFYDQNLLTEVKSRNISVFYNNFPDFFWTLKGIMHH